MKFCLIPELLYESDTYAAVRLRLEAELSDFIQIGLRRLRTIFFSTPLESSVTTLKRMPHHQIKITIGEPHQPAASRLHEGRSRKRNTLGGNPAVHNALDQSGQIHARNDVKGYPVIVRVLTISATNVQLLAILKIELSGGCPLGAYQPEALGELRHSGMIGLCRPDSRVHHPNFT